MNTCTCPSGNGSLQWPCPAHPPSPGGQVEPVTDAMVYAAEEAYANSKPDNLHESFRVAIAAALAARQPAGQEPD